MKEEIWKPIKDYEGLYEISNMGRVKSLGRKLITKGGKKYSRFPRVMKPVSQKTHPYLTIQLKIDKKYKGFLIHRLVATSFIPNVLNKKEVNHIDGNPTNNRADNLEWCSRSENQSHVFTIKKYLNKGERNPNSKLKELDVLNIVKMIKNGVKNIDIAKEYGVSTVTISDIKTGKNWGELTKR